MAYVNVITSAKDSIAKAVRYWLWNDDPPVDGAVGPKGVGSRVSGFLKGTPGAADLTLDLIAHSLNGVLQLGTWSTDDTAATQALIQELVTGGVGLSRLRLLGCCTAGFDGWKCMGALHDAFNASALATSGPIEIQGTTLPVGAGDFSHFRYAGDELVTYAVGATQPAPATAPTDATRMRWFRRFPTVHTQGLHLFDRLHAEPLSSALADHAALEGRWALRLTDSASFFDWIQRCSPFAGIAHGLLTMPEVEIFAKAAGPTLRYYRASVLLGGAFVRVYPDFAPGGVILMAPQASDIVRKQLIQASTPLTAH